MDIIFGRENAERLREKYTVLDLETVTIEDKEVEIFCLISAEKVNILDMPHLSHWIKLHNDFLNGYHTNQYSYCRQAVDHLMGKFGGEVDTFYTEILRRIDEAESNV